MTCLEANTFIRIISRSGNTMDIKEAKEKHQGKSFKQAFEGYWAENLNLRTAYFG